MEDNQDKKLLKCSRCRSTKLEKYFSINKKGDFYKTCDKCREGFKKHYKGNSEKILERNKEYYEGNKGKISEQRKEYYKGNKGKILERNKEYYEENKDKIAERHKKYNEEGRYICVHNKQKFFCKICSDPIKVTISNWISSTRTEDKKTDRYDPVKFIDKCFLEGLVEDSDKKCVYCKCDMQFLEKNKALCTIERLDNELGHNKDNVTLACWGCNNERNNKYTEEFIAVKQLQISED
jgi:hypothetical protein